MASKMIGVEIGNDSIKLALCSNNNVQQLVCRRLPDNMVREGSIAVPEAMTELLADIRKEEHLPKGNVALVLPPQAVVAHTVTMPVMSEEELKLNLPYEFRDFIGQEGAKYHYDYAILNTIKDEVSGASLMELYAAAVRKDLIDSYYDMFKKAGFTLKIATPVEMAWQNLIRLAPEGAPEICILDIGHSSSHINIYHNGRYVMGRNIDIGSAIIDETIAADRKVDTHTARSYKEANMEDILFSTQCMNAYNSLALEVMKVLNFYRYDTQSESLMDLYYCGGGSFITPLRDAIYKTTDMSLRDITRIMPGNIQRNPDSLRCALAASAGLQALERR